MKRSRTTRAFMTADVLIALVVVGILSSAVAVAVTRQGRASKQLAQTRAAMRLAEATMLSMQTGAARPAAPEGVKITIELATGGGELPKGCGWAVVRVNGPAQHAELTGIVRADAMKGATP